MKLSDGSVQLAYVKAGKLSIYIPEGLTAGDVGEPDADYSQVDAAIASAKALNKSNYVDFSKVEAAIASVVRGKYTRLPIKYRRDTSINTIQRQGNTRN